MLPILIILHILHEAYYSYLRIIELYPYLRA